MNAFSKNKDSFQIGFKLIINVNWKIIIDFKQVFK